MCPEAIPICEINKLGTKKEGILKHQAYGTSLILHKTQLELYQVLRNRQKPENLMNENPHCTSIVVGTNRSMIISND